MARAPLSFPGILWFPHIPSGSFNFFFDPLLALHCLNRHSGYPRAPPIVYRINCRPLKKHRSLAERHKHRVSWWVRVPPKLTCGRSWRWLFAGNRHIKTTSDFGVRSFVSTQWSRWAFSLLAGLSGFKPSQRLAGFPAQCIPIALSITAGPAELIRSKVSHTLSAAGSVTSTCGEPRSSQSSPTSS
jgi:hypothetical protein